MITALVYTFFAVLIQNYKYRQLWSIFPIHAFVGRNHEHCIQERGSFTCLEIYVQKVKPE